MFLMVYLILSLIGLPVFYLATFFLSLSCINKMFSVQLLSALWRFHNVELAGGSVFYKYVEESEAKDEEMDFR